MLHPLPKHRSTQQPSHSALRIVAIAILSVATLLSVKSPLFAQAVTPTHVKLTPATAAGGIGIHKISPDGSHVVYIADQDTLGVMEIYSVPITGGIPVKLNGTLAEGQNVYNFVISPDGNYVVFDVIYLTDTFALYSVPTSGGTIIRLTPDAPDGSRIAFYSHIDPISSDSHYLVYGHEKKGDLHIDTLLSIPISGGTPTVLTPPLVEGGEISGYRLSPNAQHVIYAAKQEDANITELYSVPIGGGTAVKLSIPLVVGQSVISDYVSVSRTRVTYYVRANSGNEIYSVPLEGGASIRINDVEGTASLAWSTADGTIAFYATTSGDLDSGDASFTFYSKSLNGGASLKISSSADTEGTNSTFAFVMPDSNSGQDVFFGVSTTIGLYIYHVPSAGGVNVKVVGPIRFSSLQLTADKTRLVYGIYSFNTSETYWLYSLDVATGQAITLDEVQIPLPSYYFYWALTPDQTGAIYFGRKNSSRKQLYYVPLAGWTPTVLSVDYTDIEPPLFEPETRPASYNGKTCVVYGFKKSLHSFYRSLYSSCFVESTSSQRSIYLPMISQ